MELRRAIRSSAEMGVANNIGKYQLSRTIGEGTFAKVKLAVNTENGQYVAIKIIDKHMVMENNLIFQVSYRPYILFFLLIFLPIREREGDKP